MFLRVQFKKWLILILTNLLFLALLNLFLFKHSNSKSTSYIIDLIEVDRIKLQENNVLEFITKLSVLSESNGVLVYTKIHDSNNTLVASIGHEECEYSRIGFCYSVNKSLNKGLIATFYFHDREYEIIQLIIFLSFFVISTVFLVSTAQIKHASIRAQHELFKQIVQSISNDEDLTEKYPLIPEYINELTLISDKLKKLAISQEIANLATQVSHDIRSPLAALEMISAQLGEMPEDKRLIIRNSIHRIRDIANSLTLKNRNKSLSEKAPETNRFPLATKTHELQNELLMPIIDMIVTEKRLQCRDQIGVQIDFNQSSVSYGLFSKINTSEFKRLLSNIINNAIEALPDQTGRIIIELKSFDDFNEISIMDNGIGIPQSILVQLGNRGATFNKEGGTGLGIYHAKTTLESWGGKLDISSKQLTGTTVRLLIPKEITPNWFVPTLRLKSDSTIVVFDDDQSIHQIWRKRLTSINTNNFDIIHISTPKELRVFCKKSTSVKKEMVFLMDFEIINHQETGIDLIEELGIKHQSILVTSRYEDNLVRSRCESIGVRLIPKSMSGFVPVELTH